jgi:hypothetical protein
VLDGAEVRGTTQDGEMGCQGLEQIATTTNPHNILQKSPDPSAAESGAAGSSTDLHRVAEDAVLARIIAAWPMLSARIRAAVVAVIEDGNSAGIK